MAINSKDLTKLTDKLWIKGFVAIIAFSILVIFTLNTYEGQEMENYTSLEEFTEYLDKRIPDLMEDYKIPGVNIAIVQEGRLSWTEAYGYADLKNQRNMTTDTYCRVESISKSVTAWGIMKLVQEGKIDLDKPIAQYIKNWELPHSEFPRKNITVRQLLTHTAGMPLGDVFERYSPSEEIPSLEESLSKEAVIINDPGTSFMYSNTGYNLLELLIEEVIGRDFSEYMEREILIPLGMNNSSFTWSNKLKPEVPTGYDLKGKEVPVYIYPEKASGGLFASVEDIAAFITAGMTNHVDNKVLEPKTINELYTPRIEDIGIYSLVFDSYGLGHYIEDLSNGVQAVSHGGQGGGIMTHFHAIPETGNGIVILTNSQRSWPFIANILNDWGRWMGLASLGMGKIILGQRVLWTLIVIVWFIILWQLWRLGKVFIYDRPKFSPISNKASSLRVAQILFSLILIAGFLWCINQDYLFISSVFPVVSRWLGLSIFILAIFLLLSALFSIKKVQ